MIAAMLSALLAAALLCALWLQLARRGRWLDSPGQRSSHSLPTASGGGVGIILALALATAVAAQAGVVWPPVYGILLGLAVLLMLVGLLDDRYNLPARLRLGVYCAVCALLVTAVFAAAPASDVLFGVAFPLWVQAPLLVLALLWLVNLYNFMDGIDGLATLQAFLAGMGGSLLALLAGDVTLALMCVLLALSQLGFLYWNWPPARLFMGDAGSVPLGFLLGGLALIGAGYGTLPLACWLVLLAAFVTDATWTLLTRWRAGASVFEAHRDHAYQRLSRHWGSHLAVDFLLVALNALWLFPLAWTIWRWPEFQLFLVILAYLPLLLGMAKLQRLT